MTTRRDFLKLGALFVPVVAAPTAAYSFLWTRAEPNADRATNLAGSIRTVKVSLDVLIRRYEASIREGYVTRARAASIMKGSP